MSEVIAKEKARISRLKTRYTFATIKLNEYLNDPKKPISLRWKCKVQIIKIMDIIEILEDNFYNR